MDFSIGSESVIKGWRLLEGLPRYAVVAEDGEGDAFPFDDVQQFARAVAELAFALVGGPCISVGREEALHRNSVDGQENGAGVGKVEEDGLVASDVPAGLNEAEPGEQASVTIDEGVAKGWVILVGASESQPGMAAAGEIIVRTLDDEFGVWERVMEAGVIHIEVGADYGIDLGRLKAEGREMLKNVGLTARLWA